MATNHLYERESHDLIDSNPFDPLNTPQSQGFWGASATGFVAAKRLATWWGAHHYKSSFEALFAEQQKRYSWRKSEEATDRRAGRQASFKDAGGRVQTFESNEDAEIAFESLYPTAAVTPRQQERFANAEHAKWEEYNIGGAFDNGFGIAGYLVGSIPGTLADPINIATLVGISAVAAPYSAVSAGLRGWAAARRGAAVWGAVGVAETVAITPQVLYAHHTLDKDYGGEDFMLDLVFGAAAGGVLGGGIDAWQAGRAGKRADEAVKKHRRDRETEGQRRRARKLADIQATLKARDERLARERREAEATPEEVDQEAGEILGSAEPEERSLGGFKRKEIEAVKEEYDAQDAPALLSQIKKLEEEEANVEAGFRDLKEEQQAASDADDDALLEAASHKNEALWKRQQAVQMRLNAIEPILQKKENARHRAMTAETGEETGQILREWIRLLKDERAPLLSANTPEAKARIKSINREIRMNAKYLKELGEPFDEGDAGFNVKGLEEEAKPRNPIGEIETLTEEQDAALDWIKAREPEELKRHERELRERIVELSEKDGPKDEAALKTLEWELEETIKRYHHATGVPRIGGIDPITGKVIPSRTQKQQEMLDRLVEVDDWEFLNKSQRIIAGGISNHELHLADAKKALAEADPKNPEEVADLKEAVTEIAKKKWELSEQLRVVETRMRHWPPEWQPNEQAPAREITRQPGWTDEQDLAGQNRAHDVWEEPRPHFENKEYTHIGFEDATIDEVYDIGAPEVAGWAYSGGQGTRSEEPAIEDFGELVWELHRPDEGRPIHETSLSHAEDIKVLVDLIEDGRVEDYLKARQRAQNILSEGGLEINDEAGLATGDMVVVHTFHALQAKAAYLDDKASVKLIGEAMDKIQKETNKSLKSLAKKMEEDTSTYDSAVEVAKDRLEKRNKNRDYEMRDEVRANWLEPSWREQVQYNKANIEIEAKRYMELSPEERTQARIDYVEEMKSLEKERVELKEMMEKMKYGTAPYRRLERQARNVRLNMNLIVGVLDQEGAGGFSDLLDNLHAEWGDPEPVDTWFTEVKQLFRSRGADREQLVRELKGLAESTIEDIYDLKKHGNVTDAVEVVRLKDRMEFLVKLKNRLLANHTPKELAAPSPETPSPEISAALDRARGYSTEFDQAKKRKATMEAAAAPWEESDLPRAPKGERLWMKEMLDGLDSDKNAERLLAGEKRLPKLQRELRGAEAAVARETDAGNLAMAKKKARIVRVATKNQELDIEHRTALGKAVEYKKTGLYPEGFTADNFGVYLRALEDAKEAGGKLEEMLRESGLVETMVQESIGKSPITKQSLEFDAALKALAEAKPQTKGVGTLGLEIDPRPKPVKRARKAAKEEPAKPNEEFYGKQTDNNLFRAAEESRGDPSVPAEIMPALNKARADNKAELAQAVKERKAVQKRVDDAIKEQSAAAKAKDKVKVQAARNKAMRLQADVARVIRREQELRHEGRMLADPPSRVQKVIKDLQKEPDDALEAIQRHASLLRAMGREAEAEQLTGLARLVEEYLPPSVEEGPPRSAFRELTNVQKQRILKYDPELDPRLKRSKIQGEYSVNLGELKAREKGGAPIGDDVTLTAVPPHKNAAANVRIIANRPVRVRITKEQRPNKLELYGLAMKKFKQGYDAVEFHYGRETLEVMPLSQKQYIDPLSGQSMLAEQIRINQRNDFLKSTVKNLASGLQEQAEVIERLAKGKLGALPHNRTHVSAEVLHKAGMDTAPEGVETIIVFPIGGRPYVAMRRGAKFGDPYVDPIMLQESGTVSLDAIDMFLVILRYRTGNSPIRSLADAMKLDSMATKHYLRSTGIDAIQEAKAAAANALHPSHLEALEKLTGKEIGDSINAALRGDNDYFAKIATHPEGGPEKAKELIEALTKAIIKPAGKNWLSQESAAVQLTRLQQWLKLKKELNYESGDLERLSFEELAKVILDSEDVAADGIYHGMKETQVKFERAAIEAGVDPMPKQGDKPEVIDVVEEKPLPAKTKREQKLNDKLHETMKEAVSKFDKKRKEIDGVHKVLENCVGAAAPAKILAEEAAKKAAKPAAKAAAKPAKKAAKKKAAKKPAKKK